MQKSPPSLNRTHPLYHRPLAGAKAIGALTLLHGLLLAWLVYVARTHAYCCDASYYIDASELLLRDGLLHEDSMAGYRSYFVPLVVGVMRRAAALLAPEGKRTIQLAFCAIYSGIALLAAIWMVGRHGWRRYLAIAVPIFFNPAVWGVLVFPLQEAVASLLCLPILVWLLADEDRWSYQSIAAGLVFVILAYLIRSSWLWLALPMAVFLGSNAWRVRARHTALAGSRLWLAGALILCVGILIPQLWISRSKFESWNPYPATTVGSQQLKYGVEMYRYATPTITYGKPGLAARTPYQDAADKTLDFYFDRPADGLHLILVHVWAGLNYDTFFPYTPIADFRPVTASLLLSSTIALFGTIGLAVWWRQKSDRPAIAMVTLMVLGSAAYTAFTATETRFGLWGFLALSLAAARLFCSESGRRTAVYCLPLAAVYVWLSAQINAWLYALASVA